MIKNFKFSHYCSLFSLFFSLMFISCATTRTKSEPTEMVNFIQLDKSKNFIQGNDTFIFFRLYEPSYKNPICVENTLKNLINVIEVNETETSHSAIGFSLDDNFLGMTTTGNEEWGVWYESCTNPQTNGYMKKCDPVNSKQTVYALKVSKEEFYNTVNFVNQTLNDKEIHYSIPRNILIGNYGLNRKILLPKEKQNIKEMPTFDRPLKIKEDQKRFVCSTYIAYVLINNVKSIRDFFEERSLNYNYVMPSDIAELPGVTKCFSSTFENYNNAAEQFILDYYQNKTSLNNYSNIEKFASKNIEENKTLNENSVNFIN